MKDNRISYLYQTYLAKDLTDKELAEFKSVLTDSKAESDLNSLLDERWEKLNVDELPDIPELTDHKVYHYILRQRSRIKLWMRVAVAAAIVIVVFSAGLFYYNLKNNDRKADQFSYNDIAPGSYGATLTLANGKKIRLANVVNGEVAQEAGMVIKKSNDSQIIYDVLKRNNELENGRNVNTLTTAKGETYQVKLPDGTLVYLNAASILTYSAGLVNEGIRSVRKVKLDGEGYFQVTKDKDHPFVVESNGREVEVLGTHFNVMSYSDEKVMKTTLLEGAIKISNNGKWKFLKPGEQAQITGDHIEIKSQGVDLEEVVAWKNGYFKFDENLESIMNKIARWYDVEIVYEYKPDLNLVFSGKISRSKKISSLLKIIEFNGDIHFKIEGRRIIVMK